jgi:ribosomal RNA-processing protein 12
VVQGDVEANVEEFITMVGAGLTGTTPHMISASISALTRLVFEFKGESRISWQPASVLTLCR